PRSRLQECWLCAASRRQPSAQIEYALLYLKSQRSVLAVRRLREAIGMILDFHTHVMPPEMAAAPMWQGKCPLTIENVFEAAKAGGVDKTVISNPAHELRHQSAAEQLK